LQLKYTKIVWQHGPLKSADLRSVDFVMDRLFMNLFRTNVDTVKQCQQFFLILNCPVWQLLIALVNFSHYLM